MAGLADGFDLQASVNFGGIAAVVSQGFTDDMQAGIIHDHIGTERAAKVMNTQILKVCLLQ